MIAALRLCLDDLAKAGFLYQALATLLYRRLGEIARAMAGLAARFEAGCLVRRSPCVGVPADDDVPVVVEKPVRRRDGVRLWPLQFAWLVRRAGWRAAVYGGQTEAILGQAGMVALLQASPQAVRTLRPLLRMLALDPRLLRPGMAIEPVVTQKPRVRAAWLPMDFGRIPLPRGGAYGGAAVFQSGWVRSGVELSVYCSGLLTVPGLLGDSDDGVGQGTPGLLRREGSSQ